MVASFVSLKSSASFIWVVRFFFSLPSDHLFFLDHQLRPLSFNEEKTNVLLPTCIVCNWCALKTKQHFCLGKVCFATTQLKTRDCVHNILPNSTVIENRDAGLSPRRKWYGTCSSQVQMQTVQLSVTRPSTNAVRSFLLPRLFGSPEEVNINFVWIWCPYTSKTQKRCRLEAMDRRLVCL